MSRSDRSQSTERQPSSDLPSRGDLRRVILVMGGMVILLVAVLRWQQRIWWCSCGGLDLWISDPQSSHCSQHLLDPYSFSHLLHGVLLCGIFAWLAPRWNVLVAFCATMLAEAFWEILENSPLVIHRYRTATVALGYEGDSVINSLGDMLSCAAGFLLARRIGPWWSLGVVVITELVLLVLIRDNLTLNILMLLYPIEGVRSWQSGL